MAKFLSGRQRNLSVGINSFTENKTVLDVTGKVGIGTTNAESRSLYVIGNTEITGVTTLASSGGITTTGGDLYVGGDLYIADDLVFDEFTARGANITGVATIRNANITGIATIRNANITGVATIANIVGSAATIVNLNVTNTVSTNSDFVNTNVDNLYAVSGIITDLNGTRLNYVGVSSLTVLDNKTATILDLDNLRMLSGIATITEVDATTIKSINTDLIRLNSNFGNIDVGIVTDISGTRLNYTGVGTITTLNSTNANLTIINSSGISSIADIRAQRITVSGIVTANSFRPSSGYIQAADGTNSFYIYDNTGNVAFQGTIGVNQINNASGFQVLTFNNLDTRLTGSLNIAGVTTSSVFNGNIYSLGVSTFFNGPVLIGTGTSTGTASQRLQVIGGAYFSESVGVGITAPREELDVIGDIGVQASGAPNRFVIQHNNALNSLDFVFV